MMQPDTSLLIDTLLRQRELEEELAAYDELEGLEGYIDDEWDVPGWDEELPEGND